MTRREIVFLAIAIVAVLSLPVAYHQGQTAVKQEVVAAFASVRGEPEDTQVAPCDDARLTINDWHVWRDDSRFAKPTPGIQHLAFDVSLMNTSEQAINVNPIKCRLQDTNSREYTITGPGPEPDLPMRTLQPGESMRGWVTFQVPNSIKPLAVTYAIDLQRTQIVRVDL